MTKKLNALPAMLPIFPYEAGRQKLLLRYHGKKKQFAGCEGCDVDD